MSLSLVIKRGVRQFVEDPSIGSELVIQILQDLKAERWDGKGGMLLQYIEVYTTIVIQWWPRSTKTKTFFIVGLFEIEELCMDRNKGG